MRTAHTKIPLIAFAILMVTSFVPVIHILMIQSAALISLLLPQACMDESGIVLKVLFLALAALCLFLYYRAHSLVNCIFTAIVCMACFMTSTMLMIEDYTIGSYGSLMIMSAVACWPLWLLGFIKEKQALSR